MTGSSDNHNRKHSKSTFNREVKGMAKNNIKKPEAEMRPLAIVTGASTGIGLELAKCCAKNGFDLLVAADEPAIKEAATSEREYRGIDDDSQTHYRGISIVFAQG
jgi:hypothetical protein